MGATMEQEIRNIMNMLAVPYEAAVQLYKEFNRIDKEKTIPVNN